MAEGGRGEGGGEEEGERVRRRRREMRPAARRRGRWRDSPVAGGEGDCISKIAGNGGVRRSGRQ